MLRLKFHYTLMLLKMHSGRHFPAELAQRAPINSVFITSAAITSSNDEEKAAMTTALEWILLSRAAAAICTDSQSLLKAIQSGSADTADLPRMVPTVLADQSPSPQPLHSSAEL